MCDMHGIVRHATLHSYNERYGKPKQQREKRTIQPNQQPATRTMQNCCINFDFQKMIDDIVKYEKHNIDFGKIHVRRPCAVRFGGDADADGVADCYLFQLRLVEAKATKGAQVDGKSTTIWLLDIFELKRLFSCVASASASAVADADAEATTVAAGLFACISALFSSLIHLGFAICVQLKYDNRTGLYAFAYV